MQVTGAGRQESAAREKETFGDAVFEILA